MRALRYVLLFLLVFFCLGWAGSWEEIRSNSGRITSIQADFTQEKHLKILVRPLISKGVFVFQAPDMLRWEYTAPVKSLLLMHGRIMRKFHQRNNALVEDTSPGMDAMQVVSEQISQWLAGNFTDNPVFAAELKDDGVIVLTPKNKAMSAIISKIELASGAEPGLMKSVTIYEGADSFTRLLFSHARLNTPVPLSLFTEQ